MHTHAHMHTRTHRYQFPADAARGSCFFEEAVLGEEEKLSRHEIIFILRIVVLADASALNESI